MAPVTNCKKLLLGIILFLVAIIFHLSFEMGDYKFGLFEVGEKNYSVSPSLEGSISNSSVILFCKAVTDKKLIKYHIEKILHKDADYNFPYSVGDLFPLPNYNYERRPHFEENRIVIFSSKSNIPFYSISVNRGSIHGFLKNKKIENLIKRLKQ